jgi:hypothetical protein
MMAEVETMPDVNERLPVPIRMTGSMLERWVEAGPEQALTRVDALVKTLELLRLAAIRSTYPSDWIIHTSTDSDGQIIRQVGYLQDCGADRAGKIFGIELSQPIIQREEHPDGTYSYEMLADAWSKVTGERVENAEGARWSGDTFFSKSVGPDGKVDPTDVRKAAYANLHGRAVRALGGLSAVPLDVLRTAGVDITKVVMIGYRKGERGGTSTGASVGSTDVTVAFGNSKGATPSELADKDLDWYIKAYSENVADEKKARFKDANQRILIALRTEKERRAQSASHEAETGTTAPDPNRPRSRGEKLGDLHTRLSDAVKGDAKKQAALLRTLTRDLFEKEMASLSDLSDEQLDKLNAVPEDILAKTATVAK